MRERTSRHVTAHPFELGPFVSLTANRAVERESITSSSKWLRSGAARLRSQQRVAQAHRRAAGLRASFAHLNCSIFKKELYHQIKGQELKHIAEALNNTGKTKEAYYQIIDFCVTNLSEIFNKLGKSLLLESLDIIENEQYEDLREKPYIHIIKKICTKIKELINKGNYMDLKYELITILTTEYSITEAIYM